MTDDDQTLEPPPWQPPQDPDLPEAAARLSISLGRVPYAGPPIQVNVLPPITQQERSNPPKRPPRPDDPYAIACRYCGSPPGAACRSPRGDIIAPHVMRVTAATRRA